MSSFTATAEMNSLVLPTTRLYGIALTAGNLAANTPHLSLRHLGALLVPSVALLVAGLTIQSVQGAENIVPIRRTKSTTKSGFQLLGYDRQLEIMLHLARAFKFIHSRAGIAHLAVSAENVLLVRDDKGSVQLSMFADAKDINTDTGFANLTRWAQSTSRYQLKSEISKPLHGCST